MKHLLAFSVAALTLASTAAQAQLYKPTLTQEGNQWMITFHDDRSSIHSRWATQGLCFYFVGTNGSHEVYRWVSNTYPNWNGIAEKEGDQVFMYGDFWSERGHDGMQWELVTQVKDSRPEIGAGHWHEWVENTKFGSFWFFGNAYFERKGYCSISRQGVASAGTTESYDDEVGLQLSEQALERYNTLEPPKDEKGRLLSPMGQVER
ncbi:hypothetical protein [Pseudoalteromonas sp. S16_S37]|uniref:hypothetical protein n=1 Tax=Pseudoalteromonas sp. S16_S37 TaxID=2720228 RepID=UPI0016817713|nr:hypothetical protein [Pseudoalteromonas sp. S16_S37]MBD1584067.1 hypothetical protein [Pseudoalteromonas sp. S16_S37]